MSSKLSYNNVSLSVPRLSRDPKTEEQVFQEELRLANKGSRRAPTSIYRSGQAPAWVGEEDEVEVDLLARKKKLVSQADRQTKTTPIGLAGDTASKAKRQIYTAQIVEEDKEESENERDEPVPVRREKPVDTEIKQSEQDMRALKIDVSKLEVQGDVSSDSEDSEDDINARRARARDRFLRKADDEKVEERKELEERRENKEDEKEEESSEYETDSEVESDEDYPSSRPLLKPVFVSKKDRETVAERKRMEADEEEAEEALKRRKKERKKESKRLAQEEIKREEELKKAGVTEFDGEEELPDDDDDDDEEELEKWKVRELTRIKSQKAADEKHDAEQAAILKRRSMTDEQIIRENKLDPNKRKEKGQMRYLQRYYHPGGYYQDNDEDGIRLQDFAQPTGADRVIDRTLLPEVLQVKKFGLKGNTKWTHLTDQDTSGYEYRKPGSADDERPMGGKINNPWINTAKNPETAVLVGKHKMGGLGGEFSRPSKKSKGKK